MTSQVHTDGDRNIAPVMTIGARTRTTSHDAGSNSVTIDLEGGDTYTIFVTGTAALSFQFMFGANSSGDSITRPAGSEFSFGVARFETAQLVVDQGGTFDLVRW